MILVLSMQNIDLLRAKAQICFIFNSGLIARVNQIKQNIVI